MFTSFKFYLILKQFPSIINIIEDDSLNAFASGLSERSYTISLSRGIIEKLDDDALWGVAESQYAPDKQQAYRLLLQKNAHGMLTAQERIEMNMHLEAVDRLTLQKSYAYVLLKWRGHQLPTLQELEMKH